MYTPSSYKPGEIVRFTYNRSKFDKYKEVLILNPLHKDKMHAIDLKRLTEAERMVLRTILNPEQKGKPQGIPLIRDIMTRMDASNLIKSPIAFYNQFVKTFLRSTDAYRTYFPRFMISIQTVHKSDIIGTTISVNKPLFRKL